MQRCFETENVQLNRSVAMAGGEGEGGAAEAAPRNHSTGAALLRATFRSGGAGGGFLGLVKKVASPWLKRARDV